MSSERILALIPARGGSKGIPRKNVKPFAGRPLIEHTIEDALASASVTRTAVSTDDDEIAEVSRAAGADVIRRPDEFATDEASSESALRHALEHLREEENYQPDLVVFLQCTSPIRTGDDIDAAVDLIEETGADSLVSAVEWEGFTWRRGSNAQADPVNYDPGNRPRRQDRERTYVENGSIYVFRPEVLLEEGHRLGGETVLFEMGYWSSFEIDEPEDFELCELLYQRFHRPETGLPEEVGGLVLDFDGVFTDNRVLVFEDGTEAVHANRGDGKGLELLRRREIPVLVLSSEENPVVKARCEKLGLDHLHDLDDKVTPLRSWAKENALDSEDIIYVGNDVNDLDAMRAVGCGAAVSDAHPHVLDEADLRLESRGGHGAIREICDLIIAKNDLEELS